MTEETETSGVTAGAEPSGVSPPADSTQFSTATLSDIEGLSYEQARDELVQVVTQLETGGAPLEESLALWQRGEALADRCERWLDGAQAKLEEVRQQLNAGVEPEEAA